MKKLFFRLCAALLSFIFCIGCNGSPSPDSQSIDASSEYYIFIDNSLVGSYKNGQWCSADDTIIYIGDLLQQNTYYCYSQTELLGTSEKLTFNPEDSMWNVWEDGLLLLDHADYYDWRNETITFNLPHQLPEKFHNLKCNSDITNFYFDVDLSIFFVPLALSANFNPLPKNKIIKLPGPFSKTDNDAVKAELERLGVPEAQINITECFELDYDSDSITEHFVIANAPLDEWRYVYKYSPLYYMVLMKDKTGYKTITSWSRSNDDETSNEYMALIGMFDLNNDGINELCLYKQEREWHHIYVYSLNKQNEWECVLTGSGGM